MHDQVRRLSVAPMMDCTDRYFRYLARLLTRRTLLYTEMVTTGAVLHGDRARLLAFDPSEHPVALQLGGSDPADLAECARIGAGLGFDEINLNVGCPSDRVQAGRFGACLMLELVLVARCVEAMAAAVDVPVTVKCRIGVDEDDSFEGLLGFARGVMNAGCASLAVHARKAWLSGLSPKENREIPPLRYEVVAGLKQALPALEIVLNGGVLTLEAARQHLAWADGVMIGRAAYSDPWILADADRAIFGLDPAPMTRADVVAEYLDFAAPLYAAGHPWMRIVRPLIGLFHGQPGGRLWRQRLSAGAPAVDIGLDLVRSALDDVTATQERLALRAA